MVLALLGYFGTMVAVLAGLMMLLNTILAALPQASPNPQPHPRPVIAQSDEPATKPGRWGPPVIHDGTDVGKAPSLQEAQSAARADEEKSRRLKIARAQKRRMLALRQQQQEQSYTAALGYDQEPSYSPVIGPFGTRRF
jgi:hypothetical protein